MMSLSLSWDLFIVVFFAIVMSYSFLIGMDRSMKLIVATYIAMTATQGIGTILVRLIGDGDAVFRSVGIPLDITLVSLSKIFVFALCMIIFITRSGIELTHTKDTGTLLSILYTALFGFSLSGLIASTVLSYAGGGSMIGSPVMSNSVLTPLLQSSMLLQLLAVNQDIWFTLPAFLIVAVGLAQSD